MKRAGIMLLQLVVTAAGLWYVFHDPQRRAQIAGALRHASTSWVLIGWLCYSTVEVLATVRWQILLRIQGIRLSWLQAGGIVMIGLFFSQFLPGGVGGDAMRLYFAFQLAPRRKMGAALSIAMDRLFGLLTVVFLAGMSFIVRFSWLTRSGTSRHIAYLALILLSASLAFVVLIFWLANFGLLHRLPKAVPLRKAIVESGEALGAHFAWRPWGARDSFSRVAWQSRACAAGACGFYRVAWFCHPGCLGTAWRRHVFDVAKNHEAINGVRHV